MSYIVMACIVMACIVMAYIVMACIVMACIVMAYTVIAFIVMVLHGADQLTARPASSGRWGASGAAQLGPCQVAK